MAFASLALGVGINAAACLVAFVHLLFVLLIPKAVCGASAAGDPWLAAGVTGVVTMALLLLVEVARSHLHIVRWLTVLPVVMAVGALLVVLPYLLGTTLEAAPLCSVRTGSGAGEASVVERLWAPFELLVIALFVLRTAQAWRASPVDAAS